MISNKPFILIIGVQKAGTTSIHELISKQVEVSLPKIKETHFYSKEENFNKGIDWYLNQFDITRDIMCEVDPSYFFYQNSSEWINDTIKTPKFIILFRKPIERALSHYLMSSYKGYEDLSFIDALETEPKRLKNDQNNFSLINHSYIERGNYSVQLNRYLTKFDKSNFLFIKFEDLISKKNSKQTIDTIFKFIGISNKNKDIKIGRKNKRKKIKYEFIRDLLYKDNIIRNTMKKIVPSNLLRVKLKEMINYVNSISYNNNDEFANHILNSIPDKYFTWNNEQSELLREMTNLDVDSWIY